MKTPMLRNAVEMSELHQQFDALPNKKRFNLEAGDSAKVCAVFGEGDGITGERFWVVITEVDKETRRYQGIVNNCLSYSTSHGLYFRDLISFEPKHIYDVVLRSEAAEMNRKAREEMSKPGFKNETLKAHDENQS
jgi:hypothetical protein